MTSRLPLALVPALLALTLAASAGAAYPTVTRAQWIAAKNAWTRVAAAHGVPSTGIRCAFPKYQTPYCDFGATVGTVSLHGTTTPCQLQAWAVRPPGQAGYTVKVTVNTCKKGWSKRLPVPWASA